jgi:DNA-binding beta-propeller fold protein YncE
MKKFSNIALLLVVACGSPEGKDEAAIETCEGAGNICTTVGDGRAALGEDGVDQSEVSLYLPQDMTVGPDGKLYILDWNNHRVRTVDEDGIVRTAIGTGELGDAPDGSAKQTRLNHPTHIAFSPAGKLILSAWHNSKVMEMDLGTKRIRTICGTGGRDFGGEGGPPTAAVLDLPVATAFDSDGRLYIMDQGNQRIRRIEDEDVIDTLVGPVGPYVPEGFERLCEEQTEEEIAEGRAPLCLFCKAGTDLSNCAGPPARPQGFAGEGVPGTEAFMNQPFSQSAPPAGRMEMGPGDVLYFTDSANHLVRALDPDGTVRTVLGTAPEPYNATELAEKAPRGGYEGDGTKKPLEARLNSPRDLAVAEDGTIYVADTENSCVRKLAPNGEVSTAAGICGERGFEGDGGPAEDSLLNRPYGVALGPDGELYIADTYNHRIRVVYPE